jgi:hypothetical protein
MRGTKAVRPRLISAIERRKCVMAAARANETRRRGAGRRDEAQALYLHQAARSAGEAFAFEDEAEHAGPNSQVTLVWIAVAVVAALALFYVYS